MIAILVAALPMLAAPSGTDARTIELLRESCRSELIEREVVLFANGTVRLREGEWGGATTVLGELGRAETEAFVRRLEEVEFASVELQSVGPAGDWIERCELRIELIGAPRHEIAYSRFDSGSLELDELRRIVEDLAAVARGGGGSIEIPVGYRPRLGDRLERADGAVFEVVGFTSDGKAVELVSDAPPLTVYVELAQVRGEFRRLLSRRPAL